MTFDLRLGDCLGPDGLVTLASESIDVVITDPPYSEHVHSKARTSKGGADGVGMDLRFANITQAQIEALADQFARVCRRWVAVFCDVESSHLWAGALRSTGEIEHVRTMAWVRHGAPQFTGDRPAAGFEAIVLAHPLGRKRWNGGGKGGVYRHDMREPDRFHTTQKPVALMEDLVRDFTDPGETILDPFAGSGTTGVACVRLGRKFIGWEKDEKYHTLATARLRGERYLGAAFVDERQGALFGGQS